jgi:hypothetical protein
MLVKLTPGVDFINILAQNFLLKQNLKLFWRMAFGELQTMFERTANGKERLSKSKQFLPNFD